MFCFATPIMGSYILFLSDPLQEIMFIYYLNEFCMFLSGENLIRERWVVGLQISLANFVDIHFLRTQSMDLWLYIHFIMVL